MLIGKRILVTGGAGFVGSVVSRKLRECGCEVFVPRRSVASSFVPFRKYNLVDSQSVKSLYKDVKPNIVIHLAAVVGGIGANKAHPAKFFYENLMMGALMIEEGRLAGVEKFVCIGSVCCYPKFTPVPFVEDKIWDGYPEETNAPYGLAKKMMLVQSQAYRQEYGFNSIYLIPVNMYGPGDNFNPNSSHVIPAIIKKSVDARLSGATKVVLWGTGNASREFLYVDDAADAIVKATECYNKPLPVNIGTGKEITIKALATLIAEIVGFDGEIVWDETNPDGQPRRCLDTSRASKEFGFNAKVNFLDGLRKTIEWYVNQPKPA